MKWLISSVILFSLSSFATDPGERPDAAIKEKVESTQETGGALKVEKTPAKIDGLPEAKEQDRTTGRKLKKKKKTEEK